MARAAKVCSHPDCPNLQPCPDHTPKPWASSRRRERLRKRSGSREQKLARAVMARDEGICHWCGKGGADQVDHVIPLAEGGADDYYNRAPIHSTPCHQEKTQAEAERARNR
jgi:5-methylcytosine-specific restriction protein A